MSHSLSIFGLHTRGEEAIKGLIPGPDGIFEEFFYNDGYEFRTFWPNDINAEKPALFERVCHVVWDSGPNLFTCLDTERRDENKVRHVPHESCWSYEEINGALGIMVYNTGKELPLKECAS